MNLESQSERYELVNGQINGQPASYLRQVSGPGFKKLKPKKKEWQERVYKKNENIEGEQAKLLEYHALCKIVFKRNRHICQSCLKTRRKLILEQKFLTAHHIIPRSEYDFNELDNLITLCNDCHDKIEELKLRSAPEILGYFSPGHKRWSRQENIGVKWQQWVYGGFKNPNK